MGLLRRSFLRRSLAVFAGTGLLGAAGASAADSKIAPQTVDYQETPKDGRACAACSFFEPPSACKAVSGKISPTGWCKLWAAKN